MDAKNDEIKANEALAAGRLTLREVMKAAEKIELHREGWLKDMKHEHERQQDLEMEDFHTKTVTDGDGYDEFFDEPQW